MHLKIFSSDRSEPSFQSTLPQMTILTRRGKRVIFGRFRWRYEFDVTKTFAPHINVTMDMLFVFEISIQVLFPVSKRVSQGFRPNEAHPTEIWLLNLESMTTCADDQKMEFLRKPSSLKPEADTWRISRTQITRNHRQQGLNCKN